MYIQMQRCKARLHCDNVIESYFSCVWAWRVKVCATPTLSTVHIMPIQSHLLIATCHSDMLHVEYSLATKLIKAHDTGCCLVYDLVVSCNELWLWLYSFFVSFGNL